MNPEEVKDRLKSVINNVIKDQPEEATKELHDILAAKMRQRITGEEDVVPTTDEVVPDGDEGEGDEVVVADPPSDPE